MEEKKIDRKKLEIIIITVATILIAIFSVSYGFFQDQIGAPTNANVNIGTGTPDDLRFNVSKDISINVNQFNFGVGAGNRSDSAVATASLLANSTYNTATYTYYVYFKINTNEYIYTTADNKPEIILTVTDPNGNPVTAIDGLTYVQNIQTTTSSGTTQTVSGFDITTATGTFAVASNYTITSNSSTSATTQNWNFTATFINLETDQADNTGKTLDAEILIQQNELKPTLAEYVISQYTGVDGENGLYYHNSSLANGAGDNSYRYAGANPNNYICFGSTASTCPDANLYRIIGVFGNQVKLIMADYPTTSQTGTSGAYYTTYANSGWSTSYYKGDQSLSSVGTYYWNPSRTNTWSSSPLTTINLKSTFLNSISSTWRNKIADATWYVGGYSTSDATPATWHDNESTGTTWTGKIGLMYISDYGFASSPSAWTTNVGSYNSSSITSNNWMYMGLYEWTISRDSSRTSYAYGVRYNGRVDYRDVNYYYAVRPSFYLESSVNYVSGTGTESDPFRIA